MKDEPWRGDPGARLLHLEKKIHNQKCEVERLKALTPDIVNYQDEVEIPDLRARAEKAEAERDASVLAHAADIKRLREAEEKLQAAEQRAADAERTKERGWSGREFWKGKADLFLSRTEQAEADLAAARERIERLTKCGDPRSFDFFQERCVDLRAGTQYQRAWEVHQGWAAESARFNLKQREDLEARVRELAGLLREIRGVGQPASLPLSGVQRRTRIDAALKGEEGA